MGIFEREQWFQSRQLKQNPTYWLAVFKKQYKTKTPPPENPAPSNTQAVMRSHFWASFPIKHKVEFGSLAGRQTLRRVNREINSFNFNCPHCNQRFEALEDMPDQLTDCQTSGQVRTKDIKQKKGISGGKATAALLTGGVSMLATGLSRKEGCTQAHCVNCDSTWVF